MLSHIFRSNLRKATISIKVKPYIGIYKWNERQEDMRYFLIRMPFIRFRPDSFKHDKINNKYNKNITRNIPNPTISELAHTEANRIYRRELHEQRAEPIHERKLENHRRF